MSHRITPKHQAKPPSTRTHHLVAIYCNTHSAFFWLLALALLLAGPPSGLAYRPFVVDQTDTSSYFGLTVPTTNINLLPSPFGLLPESMFVFVSLFFLPFLLPDTL